MFADLNSSWIWRLPPELEVPWLFFKPLRPPWVREPNLDLRMSRKT
jgi:hypothetical protein